MVDRLIVDVHHRRMELIGNTKRTRWRRGLDTGDESVLGHIGKFYGFVVAMKNGHRRNGAENFFLKEWKTGLFEELCDQGSTTHRRLNIRLEQDRIAES